MAIGLPLDATMIAASLRRHDRTTFIAKRVLRRGEALALEWDDIDLEAASLSVRRALIPNGREVVVSAPKTARGRRVVALDPATVAVRKVQAARQLAEQAQAKSWSDTGLIFTREDGEALHPEVVSRFFRQAVRKAMLPAIRLHDLRHTHATLALRAGIHPSQGGFRKAWARDRLDHPRHLLTCHPGDAGRGSGANRGVGVRGK